MSNNTTGNKELRKTIENIIKIPRCSFCLKGIMQVEMLFKDVMASICNECITACIKAEAEHKEKIKKKPKKRSK